VIPLKIPGLKSVFNVIWNGWKDANDEHTAAFIRGDDIHTGDVNTETAMKYSAVNACVRVLSETFACVPALTYKKNKDGRDPVTGKDLLLADVLHGQPNDEMSPYSFKECIMANFTVGGNIVCERLVNKAGELVGLYPYNHAITKIERNRENKKLEYKIGSGNDQKSLSRAQVLHVPNLSFDGVIGLSPIAYAAQAILLGLSYEKFGMRFYQNAATPSGVFFSDKALSDEAYERLKKGIKENWTGLEKSGIPLLLEDGMKWAQVTINPVDAQLLESKYFQLEDIARIYRVPQHLIGKLDRATWANIEQQSLEFVMYTMLPIFKRFEDAINCQLLTRQQRAEGYYVEFKVDALLRGDSKTRAETYAKGRQWGWLSVNDIRRLENMPAIENGDRYLEPGNMTEAGSVQEKVDNLSRLAEDIYAMIRERR
jgi:HK97 family phage portal protein